jgi:uncharacterized protein YjiS (DUF1127 family)
MTNYIAALARPMSRRSAALPQLLGSMATLVGNWRRRRRDQNALMRQPEYLLRDIGLERHEIERALHGRPYY